MSVTATNHCSLNPIALHKSKHLLALLCVCLFSVTLAGQAPGSFRPSFQIGAKGNLQSAGIANQNNYGQNEMDYGVHLGVGGGVAVTCHLNAKHEFLLEGTFQSSGQNYEDHFKMRTFRKEVNFQLISIPLIYRYQFSAAPEGYTGVGTKPKWFAGGGIQVNKILNPEINWYLDGQETDFLPFVLEGGNPNQQVIESMGAPAEDEDLFSAWDAMLVASGGCRIGLSYLVSVTAELRGGIGITDINASAWRLENNDGVYRASRNTFFGLHAGVHVRLN